MQSVILWKCYVKVLCAPPECRFNCLAQCIDPFLLWHLGSLQPFWDRHEWFFRRGNRTSWDLFIFSGPPMISYSLGIEGLKYCWSDKGRVIEPVVSRCQFCGILNFLILIKFYKILSNIADFSQISNIFVKFWHFCKISKCLSNFEIYIKFHENFEKFWKIFSIN